VIVLLWVYYSSQIMLFGAEFTKVYAHRCGTAIFPHAGAMRLSEQARVQQGIPSQAGGMSEALSPDRPQLSDDPARLQRSEDPARPYAADGADAAGHGVGPRPAPTERTP